MFLNYFIFIYLAVLQCLIVGELQWLLIII